MTTSFHTDTAQHSGCLLELQTKVREKITIMEKAPTMIYACLAQCLNSVLNVKALVDTFNQEKALKGAFFVIVQLHQLIDLRHQF